MSFNEAYKSKVLQINEILEKYLPEESGNGKTIFEAVNYSVRVGGKRIRPLLFMETYYLYKPSGERNEHLIFDAFLTAIELIHTYSLVHDDLPAMDNDLLRRGKPTTHAVYGEAMGILAGDALLNYAFEVVSDALSKISSLQMQTQFDSSELLQVYRNSSKALSILAAKAGMFGMINGQAVDMEYTGKALTKSILLNLYEHKTSALLEAAMMTGAVLGGASDNDLFIIESLASKLGLAFQICDDILDITGTEAVLGKPIHSDEKNDKTTYAVLTGIETAKAEAEQLTKEVLDLLNQLPGDKSFLQDFIQFLLFREW